MSIPSIIADWDKYIRDTPAAYAEIARSTTERSNAVPVTKPDDIQVVGRLWNVAKAEFHKHGERVQDYWSTILDRLADATPDDENLTFNEGKKRDVGILEMEITYEKAMRLAMAHAAEKLLAAGKDAEHLAAAGHLIGDAAAIEPWEQMVRAGQAMKAPKNRKEVPLAVLETYADSARRYHQTRLETEARYTPINAPHVAMKVEGQMQAIMRELKVFWQWKAAHP